MRTNSTSSFLSSANLDEVLSTSTATVTANSGDDAQYFKALQSYGKYFTMRLVQVLVQSRTNEKFAQSCVGVPANPPDWFNMKIDELGEVSAQIKRSIGRFPPEVPEVTIDFFLYTVDQEMLPLESWTFSVDKSKKEVSEDSKSEVYHQLTTLLRSSMVAARMTPMHRYYVKKQSAETFVILYKIVSGPSAIDLGAEAKCVTLGSFPTLAGTFRLNLTYRTRMVIDRTQVPASDPATESFQKILFSPGTTPDSAQMAADSPISFDAVSHISTSPPMCSPISSPPDNEAELCKIPPNFKVARSRSTSIASDGVPTSSSAPKESGIVSFSQNRPIVAKNMPFANLLTMSYTGALFPVHEGEEKEKKEDREQEGPDSDSSTIVGNNNSRSLSASSSSEDNGQNQYESQVQSVKQTETDVELAQSQGTVVNEMSETVKPPSSDSSATKDDSFLSRDSTDDRFESDDDSFVKIPIFLSSNSDPNCLDGTLGELISSCKAPPQLESFVAENLIAIESQLLKFSNDQGNFDRFIAEIRDLVEKEALD